MPRKKAVDSNTGGTVDNTRVQTRRTNVDKHPGKDAQDALRVSKPRRDPNVIQEEKDQKKDKREGKLREQLEEKARQEAFEKELEEYRAQQLVDLEKESAKFPRRQSKSKSQIMSSFHNLT